MAVVTPYESESLSEYLIIPGKVKCRPAEVSLEATLGETIQLQYPFATARMQSVVGPEMAVVAGRNGILVCVPRSLRDEDKQAILDANNRARLKKGDVQYVGKWEGKTPELPEFVYVDQTLADVRRVAEKTGHSVVPVLDRRTKLTGVCFYDSDNMPDVPDSTCIQELMTPLKSEANPKGIPYLLLEHQDNIGDFIKGKRVVPIVHPDMTLEKLAFSQKFGSNYIGIAISSGKEWHEELERWGPQVDTMMLDSSNVVFPDALTILKEAKRLFPGKPFGVGNTVNEHYFNDFADAGADYVIVGMGVGSICQTGSKRGNGRGQFTAARLFAQARDEYYKKSGRYVWIIVDGGITCVKDMTVALAFGDMIMMGSYFNGFKEAAGRKFDADEKPTGNEALMRFVETWGEGHPHARHVGLYGMDYRQNRHDEASADAKAATAERYHQTSMTRSTVEGVIGTTVFKGRLKPNVESDAAYIRVTVANSGAKNLADFRRMAVLEHASAATQHDMLPHDVHIMKDGGQR